MNIRNKEKWEELKKSNYSSYGKTIIEVAEEVMKLLDNTENVKAKDLVTEADKNLNANITGYMAGIVANLVSSFHEKGEKFRISWNNDIKIGEATYKIQDNGGVKNPAIITFERKNNL